MHAKLKQRVTGLNAGLLPFIDLFNGHPTSIACSRRPIHPPWTTPMQTYLRKRKRPTASVASRLTAASLSPTKCCLSPCTLANISNHALASYRGVEKRRLRSAGRSGREEEEEEIDDEDGGGQSIALPTTLMRPAELTKMKAAIRTRRNLEGTFPFRSTAPKVTSEDYDLGSQDEVSQSNGEDKQKKFKSSTLPTFASYEDS
ncbi:hypothetical protein GALMADRAFT_148111 [Galerina marginata CBS 339.88]|uniref:Uncharacterized protein n=1 Tax=Galerina marginata (strain CBS 339.88) TaxID=685588 RepID=A0A067S5X6_GALM3|nr:hypothetical protein GALMADRAFT_148111 [Galerina marginata CBS 339.88]